MKTITNLAIALFMGCTFIACQKAGDEIIDKKESIEIKIDADGGKYAFASNTVNIISAPYKFNAEVVNNTIVGNYAGSTKAIIKSSDTIYECVIKVKPSFTYYIDMIIYMGVSKNEIEKLYGTHIRINKSTYYYKPLSSYLAEKEVAFTYDDNNKVIACASYFTLYQMTNVVKHLQQRYATYGISDGIAFYGNALDMDNASVVVMCGIGSATIVYASQAMLKSRSNYADEYTHLFINNQ